MLNIEYYKKDIYELMLTNNAFVESVVIVAQQQTHNKIKNEWDLYNWAYRTHDDTELTAEEVEWLANMLSRYSKSNITIERRFEESNDQYYLKIVIDKNISVFSIAEEEYQSLELFKEYTPCDLKLESFYEVEDEYL